MIGYVLSGLQPAGVCGLVVVDARWWVGEEFFFVGGLG